MKRRLDKMASEVQARREAAWKPLIDHISEESMPDEAFALMRGWGDLPEEKQVAGWAQVEDAWGADEEMSAWKMWWQAFDAALCEKGVGAWPRVAPEQVPLPPEEPAGLRPRLCSLAEESSSEDLPTRCAAAYALLWIAIARGLRFRAASVSDTP